MIVVWQNPDNEHEWRVTWEPESADERRWHVGFDDRHIARVDAEARLLELVARDKQRHSVPCPICGRSDGKHDLRN
jgi:hypothetical protein